MSDQLKTKVGDRLRAARETTGLTQDEVAVMLGIKKNSYNQIETGKNSLTLEHLVKLPDILQHSVNYLLDLGMEEITPEEMELVELFRMLPDGFARESALMFLRGWVEQVNKRS